MSRLAGANPVHLSLSPVGVVASLAAWPVTTALMRRYASMRAVGMQPTKGTIPVDVAEGVRLPESNSATTAMGEGRSAAGEVFDHGTYEEDGPVTWEILISPRVLEADGEPQANLRRVCVHERRHSIGEEQAFVSR